MFTDFIQGWGFTVAALGLICVVFVTAWLALRSELEYVKALTDFLGQDLARRPSDERKTTLKTDATPKHEASLRRELVRDEANAIRGAGDRAWANKQVRGWQMRTQRIEPALAFWVDFLRQLGLLFTVVGLGLSFTFGQTKVEALLQPLSLSVWTTVAGLSLSLILTAQFGMKIAVWADTCEKNIEAWDEWRKTAGSTSNEVAS